MAYAFLPVYLIKNMKLALIESILKRGPLISLAIDTLHPSAVLCSGKDHHLWHLWLCNLSFPCLQLID